MPRRGGQCGAAILRAPTARTKVLAPFLAYCGVYWGYGVLL